MFNKQEYEGYLALLDKHIRELQERINSLRVRISVMPGEGYDTLSQRELMTNMLTVMGSLQTISLETLEALKIGDERTCLRPNH